MKNEFKFKFLPYLPNSNVEALTPNVIIFGERNFKKVIGWGPNPI